ncbi:Mini-ribonuclease 3 [Kroppenstedtia pulmonis]
MLGMADQVLNKEPGQLNPLLLAYMGDAVYELFVRYHVVAEGNIRPSDVHQKTVGYVSAIAQAKAVRQIEEYLTEEEWQVLKRGRNAKSSGVPKNAKVSEYRYSTGLEALVGYWYLKGEAQRLREMITRMIRSLEEDEQHGQ